VPLPTLADLKAHQNMSADRTTDDAELGQMLAAATEHVVAMVGDLTVSSVTETVRVVGGTAILSRRPTGPVLSGGQPVGGVVDPGAGLVTNLGYHHGRWRPPTITVTYPVSSDVPASVALAVLIIAAHLWETQRGAGPTALQGDDTTATVGLGFAIPNRARELLGPYLRPTQVA
jgi:hypothetical protein